MKTVMLWKSLSALHFLFPFLYIMAYSACRHTQRIYVGSAVQFPRIMVPILGPISPPKRTFGVTT
ncbi:hypothetical protein E2C01_048513 [Portunus trituberculatus]|uniref:Uncharacterized protein n=1 Tax=Portunus trituberculatus TaxID=210409 RepID=A0A5B7G3B7_PORTR|nr:hypothetical protein [Portunus trituberculatus]